MWVSDLNLVNCLLIFLLSGLKETLCVVNNLFETVLLEDRDGEGEFDRVLGDSTLSLGKKTCFT